MITLYKSDVHIYLTSEVAQILGCEEESVSRLCKKFNAPKLGRYYVINDELLEDLRSRNTKRGRPISI